jgi:hypothetical protein
MHNWNYAKVIRLANAFEDNDVFVDFKPLKNEKTEIRLI